MQFQGTSNQNSGYFDLSGVFNVQQNYLVDLSNSYPNVNNAAAVATYVNQLQNQMKQVSANYQQANTSGEAVLDQQNQMIGIITAEQERLLEKQQLMDQADMQQQRIALLNNSYRLRYAEYSKIMIVFVIGLVIHIVLRLIGNYFQQIPLAPLIMLHLLNIIICGIIMMYIYVDIQSRDQINFNQLSIPPPNLDPSANNIPDTSGNYDNLWNELGVCVGSECCGPNTVWNTDTSTCDIVSSPSPGQSIPMSVPAPAHASVPAPAPSTAPSAAQMLVASDMIKFNKVKPTPYVISAPSRAPVTAPARAPVPASSLTPARAPVPASSLTPSRAPVSAPSRAPSKESFVGFMSNGLMSNGPFINPPKKFKKSTKKYLAINPLMPVMTNCGCGTSNLLANKPSEYSNYAKY